MRGKSDFQSYHIIRLKCPDFNNNNKITKPQKKNTNHKETEKYGSFKGK